MSNSLAAIYLDNNATTRMDPRVAHVIEEAYRQRYANPASQHAEGRRARAAVEKAVDRIARVLGCRRAGMEADKILLTSGGTESNNLAVFGCSASTPGDLIVSSIEHPSVLEAAEKLGESRRRKVFFLPASSDGTISLDAWRDRLAEHRSHPSRTIAMVSVMLANNETGVIQPIEEIARDCREEGIIIHSDAVQVLGKTALNFSELGVDAMTVTPHKVHGPTGIGALVLRHHVPLQQQLFGGFQQLSLRPGTESVPLVIGFAEAVELCQVELTRRSEKMLRLRQRLEAMLLASSSPPTVIGAESRRLPHTLSIAFPGINRQALQMALDRAGVMCSTGSACASGSGVPSHVLTAMKLPAAVVDSAIRLSLSYETTDEEVEQSAIRILQVVEKWRR